MQDGKLVKFQKRLSAYSYIVAMPNGSRRHLDANRLRKLVIPSERIDLNSLSHLSEQEQTSLLTLLDEFRECFSDTPGMCMIVEHAVQLTNDFKPRQTRA